MLLNNILNPIIPIVQYSIFNFKRTNEYEDAAVVIIAASMEEDLYKVNFIERASLRSVIKESTKIACKHYLFIEKSYSSSFICEILSGCTSSIIGNLLNSKDISSKFLVSITGRSLSEATAKIPASFLKKSFIEYNPIMAEYIYRVTSNFGKFIYLENGDAYLNSFFKENNIITSPSETKLPTSRIEFVEDLRAQSQSIKIHEDFPKELESNKEHVNYIDYYNSYHDLEICLAGE